MSGAARGGGPDHVTGSAAASVAIVTAAGPRAAWSLRGHTPLKKHRPRSEQRPAERGRTGSPGAAAGVVTSRIATRTAAGAAPEPSLPGQSAGAAAPGLVRAVARGRPALGPAEAARGGHRGPGRSRGPCVRADPSGNESNKRQRGSFSWFAASGGDGISRWQHLALPTALSLPRHCPGGGNAGDPCVTAAPAVQTPVPQAWGHFEDLHPVGPGGALPCCLQSAGCFVSEPAFSFTTHRPSEVAWTVLIIILFLYILRFAKHLNVYIPAALFRQNLKTSQ